MDKREIGITRDWGLVEEKRSVNMST